MKYTALLVLLLMPFSLNAYQESRIPIESRDPIERLIQTYCGDKPLPMSFVVQFSDGSQKVVPRMELNDYKKIDPNLVVLGESEPGGQYSVCRNMVVKKQ